MSTTVKYKGNTIATLTSETKSLTTSGTWLEDDIELTDHSVGYIYQDEDGYLVISDTGEDNVVDTYNNYTCNKTIPKIVNLTGTKIRSNLFEDSKTIEEIYAPDVTDIFVTHSNGGAVTGNCFYGCTNLKIASLPKLQKIGDGMFRGCSNLVQVDLSSVINLAYTNSFFGCSKIPTFVFHNLTPDQKISTGVFASCTALTAVDLESTGTFQFSGQNIFKSDSNLSTLILRVDSLTTLSYANCFDNTPFASNGTGGTLYVPSSLVSTYQSATNWSVILGYTNNSIQAIEGSQYENYYADGTAVSS